MSLAVLGIVGMSGCIKWPFSQSQQKIEGQADKGQQVQTDSLTHYHPSPPAMDRPGSPHSKKRTPPAIRSSWQISLAPVRSTLGSRFGRGAAPGWPWFSTLLLFLTRSKRRVCGGHPGSPAKISRGLDVGMTCIGGGCGVIPCGYYPAEPASRSSVSCWMRVR
jgi:hypothetical protein